MSTLESLGPVMLHLECGVDLSTIPPSLGIDHSRPVLVIVGGASKLSDADLQRVQSLFTQALAPLAQDLDLVVIDGGTDAGVMRLMGQARRAIGCTFPLVGVIPAGLAELPNTAPPCDDAAEIELNHSHCLLVPGCAWGDESAWIADLASVIATAHPSVTVLINGGEVSWKDVAESVRVQRPTLIIAGSGRAADVLAAALRGEAVNDDRAAPLLASGLLQSIELHEDPAVLAATLRGMLTTKE